MIIAFGVNEAGGPLLLIGLSKMNIQKLMEGMPIDQAAPYPNDKPMRLIILYGETEADIQRDIEKVGFVDRGSVPPPGSQH